MDGRSIESSFQFISYKIDDVSFRMEPVISNILQHRLLDKNNLVFNFGFRDLSKFKENKVTCYIGGLELRFDIIDEGKKLASGSIGIEGVFSSEDMRPELEEILAKQQIPAILLPYARSFFTMLLSQAGFGTVALPLINIHKAAKDAKIKIIEIKDSPQ